MRGRNKYVPPSVLAELERIKKNKNISRDSIAFDHLAQSSRLGQEIEIVRDKFLLIDVAKRRRKYGR